MERKWFCGREIDDDLATAETDEEFLHPHGTKEETFPQTDSEKDILSARILRCQYCYLEVKLEDALMICSDCYKAYHPICWERNKGCVIFGCKGQLVAVCG